MKHPSPTLHTAILMRYYDAVIRLSSSPIAVREGTADMDVDVIARPGPGIPRVTVVPSADSRIKTLDRISQMYLPRSAFFAHAFSLESSQLDHVEQEQERILRVIFERWQVNEDRVGDAAVAWSKWLVGNGNGREAGECMRRLMGGKSEALKRDLEVRWKEVLDGFEAAGAGDGGKDTEMPDVA